MQERKDNIIGQLKNAEERKDNIIGQLKNAEEKKDGPMFWQSVEELEESKLRSESCAISSELSAYACCAVVDEVQRGDVMGLFHVDGVDGGNMQLCPVEHAHRGGEKLSITIDSGAAESIMPRDRCADYPLSAGMWTGSQYGTADGGTITNLGERLLVMDLKGGDTRGMQFQVGDKATKALGAVSRIADKGNRVVFEAEYGYIQNLRDGKCTYFDRKDDVYVMDTIVRPYSASFQRQS